MFISNPPLPYCGAIGSPLHHGSMIRVSGQSNGNASHFVISIQCGPSGASSPDIALYLSPMFNPPPRIVRNSLIANCWGAEESFGGFPLSSGQPFEFLIMVESSEFKIALNGQHFTEFRHRLGMERITHISVAGDVHINTISVEGTGYASASAPPAPSAPLGMPFPSSGGSPYPPYPTGSAGASPYPMPSGSFYPSLPNETSNVGFKPYPAPSSGAPYVPQSMPGPNMGPYPSQPYPATSSAYPSQAPPGAYMPQSYPYPGQTVPPPPPGQGYPQSGSSGHGSGIGGMIGSALAGVTGGMAASTIGNKIFGNKSHGILSGQHHGGHHKKSNPIPIGTIAAGAGAAALGAAVLTGNNPLKKAKKLFKHKHKIGKFKHHGWGSSSSSSSSEEEE